MSLFAQLNADIITAMKARDADRLGVLRMLKSSMKMVAAEKNVEETALDDLTFTAVVRKEVKKRQDSIESFTTGNRPELAAKEASEAEMLAVYLPKALSAEEAETIVKAVIAELGATSKAQMGAVMKAATERAAGRADGKALSALVGQLLA